MSRVAIVSGAVLCIAAAALAWYFVRTPFPKQYEQAIAKYHAGQYAEALPVLRKGARILSGKQGGVEALMWLARCETAVDATNAGTWAAVAVATSNRAYIAEARYRLALASADKEAAIERFSKEFPERPEARQHLVDSGSRALARNDVMAAWAAWQTLYDSSPDSPEALGIRAQLGDLNMKLLCSPRPQPFCVEHTVAPGELLLKIAQKYRRTADPVKRVNQLRSDIIRPGTKLKIDQSEYLIRVDTTKHELCLYRIWQDSTNFVKAYSVGTGKNENTPIGAFKITLKQKNPTWYKPGGSAIPFGSPENLLGTRWLGIDCPGFGIHGTWEPESVGMSSSLGCVRMLNEEVEELADLVPLGTEVIIFASPKQ